MFLSRQIIRSSKSDFVRKYSSGKGNLVKVSVNDKTGFASVSMSSPPVNSLNLELLTSLNAALTELEKNKCRGMIITSDLPTIFCAGLDINEIHKPDLDRFNRFWATFQESYLKLYCTPYPTVAAINGHSPAGGCAIALACDCRIMVGPKFIIGLNEIKVGVVAPVWLMDCMKNVLGSRQSELALTSGKLFTAPEALKVGLIDEMVNSKDEALQKAEGFLEGQTNLPPLARSITKTNFRLPVMDWLINRREEDAKMFYDFIIQDEVQQNIDQYLSSLKK